MSPLRVPPGPGLPRGIEIPDDLLDERFSRSSGPGGQGVNTTDSRVQLGVDLRAVPGLTRAQQARLVDRLAPRMVDGRLVVDASESRSQRRNRAAARERVVGLVREALAPPPPARRATRRTRGSVERRLQAKRRRSKALEERRFRGE